MQKHFVRTIFLGCTQNLHLATRLQQVKLKYVHLTRQRKASQNLIRYALRTCVLILANKSIALPIYLHILLNLGGITVFLAHLSMKCSW